MLLLLPILFGCRPPDPPPVDKPFISDMLVGRWLGEWSADLPGQSGVAEITAVKKKGQVNFDLSISGGAIADPEDPLTMFITGNDDTTQLALEGHADFAGDVVMLIDPDGNVTGSLDPDLLPPVGLTGWVRDYEFVLHGFIYGLIPATIAVFPVNEETY